MPTEWVERQAAGAAAERTLTGWHVLVAFIAFFAVVAGVNAYMVTNAIRSMSGLDARNGYDPSQRYNAEIAAARAQAERGTQATVVLGQEGGARIIRVILADRKGRPLAASAVDAVFQHPGTKARDVVVPLSPEGIGSFVGRTANLAPGAWTLALTVTGDDGAVLFRSRQRMALMD